MATYVKKGKGYLITVSDGYDEHYKQIRHRMQWNPDPSLKTETDIQKELEHVAQEFEDKVKGRKIVKSGTTKFSIVLGEYYEHITNEAEAGRMSELSVDRYYDEKARLIESFGHKQINKITCTYVDEFLKSLCRNGANKNTGKALSTKSQKQVLNVLSNVFKFAIENGYALAKNPCDGLKIKGAKKTPRKIDTYNENEMILLSEHLKKAPIKYQLFFSLLANTGVRAEEIIGLKWECVDLDKKTIYIENAVSYSKRKGNIEHRLKTDSSYRYVAIRNEVVNLFKIYKKAQSELIEALGDKWIPCNYVFTGENGGMMGSNTARHWFKRFCEKEGLRYISLKGFRHYSATTLFGYGVPNSLVSEVLGHSNPYTTQSIYFDAIHKLDAESEQKHQIANMIGINSDFGYGSNE